MKSSCCLMKAVSHMVSAPDCCLKAIVKAGLGVNLFAAKLKSEINGVQEPVFALLVGMLLNLLPINSPWNRGANAKSCLIQQR